MICWVQMVSYTCMPILGPGHIFNPQGECSPRHVFKTETPRHLASCGIGHTYEVCYHAMDLWRKFHD